MRQNLISLASGTLFGAGLAISGMIDPARVRAFLDVTGAWDPTLAFVMAGAILPMAIAWFVVRRRSTPIAAEQFHTPATSPIDRRLIGGAALFGIDWSSSLQWPSALPSTALHSLPAVRPDQTGDITWLSSRSPRPSLPPPS